MIPDFRIKIERIKKRVPSLTNQQYSDIENLMLEYNDETFEYYMKLAEILYGDISDGGLTFEEKGIVLGVTRERIRQIEKTAIAKLKHPRINYKLRQYIDKEYGNE